MNTTLLTRGQEPFERLVRTHQDRLFACAYRLTGNRDDADTVRRRPRFVLQSLDEVLETEEGTVAGREIADPHGGPETELMEKTLSEPIQRALDALPAEFRSVVVLAEMQGLSYEEVARALRCPVGTVRSRLHRARALLRRSLLGDGSRPARTPAFAYS